MHRATCHIIGKPYSHYITLRSQAYRLQCLSLVLMIMHVLYLFFAVNHQLNPLNSMSKLSIYLMQTAAKGSVFRMNLYLKFPNGDPFQLHPLNSRSKFSLYFFQGQTAEKQFSFRMDYFQTEIHFREYIFPRHKRRSIFGNIYFPGLVPDTNVSGTINFSGKKTDESLSPDAINISRLPTNNYTSNKLPNVQPKSSKNLFFIIVTTFH